MLSGRKVLIGIGGGIAAYKICEVISSLFKAGAEVRVILTQTAQQFITPLTVSTLSRHRAYTDRDFWQSDRPRPLHIDLGEWAEIFLLAPLTANTLGKLTYGLADNLLTNTVLASRCPILLAPAMNTEMWEQTSVQRNWKLLRQDLRYHNLEPGSGLLACDRVGAGRMAEPTEILIALQSLLHSKGDRDLINKRILISAGGTREYLDPVRFLGNPSTGKMGIALAQAAKHRGAEVTLVHAPIDEHLLTCLKDIRAIAVTSATEMRKEMLNYFSEADWIIMSAAVADVKPANYVSTKIPKQELPSRLSLESVPDIIAELGYRKQPHQLLIGFAAQTNDIFTPAFEKMTRKKLDAIVANPVDKSEAGFASNTNQAIYIAKDGRSQEISLCSKLELAHHLFDLIQKN
ncbi:MAG: bifunctional phosphopantothenoylcysteine decarboxylase/phosphopantothenate--cysteine ligase CoaBC [Xenococcaceae cyanobacterium]